MRRLVALALLLAPLAAAAQGPGAPAVIAGRPLNATPFTPLSPNQTIFISIDGSNVSTNSAQVASRFVSGGTLAGIAAALDIAPGTGESVALTVVTGTCGSALADSALTITVSGTSITGANALTAPITAGHCAAIKVQTSASAAVLTPNVQVEVF